MERATATTTTTITTTIITGTEMRLARFAQLVSPALPVGAFAYSQGLETATERGWVTDVGQAQAWISGQLERTAASLDAPLLLRLHDAWRAGDVASIERWGLEAYARRESAELQLESRTMASAMARLLRGLFDEGLPVDVEQHDALAKQSWLSAFALAATCFDLNRQEAAQALLVSWLEQSIGAAIKLVPLGQTDGQRLYFSLGGTIDAHVTRASELSDDEIGALAPRFALACALHETQNTRLFRS